MDEENRNNAPDVSDQIRILEDKITTLTSTLANLTNRIEKSSSDTQKQEIAKEEKSGDKAFIDWISK